MSASVNRRTLTYFWQYTRRYKLLFWTGTIGAALAVVVQSITPPIIIARTFDKLQQLYSSGQPIELHDFTPYIILFGLAMIVGMLLWRLQAYCVWQLEIRVRRDMAVDIYDHLQHQSQHFHANRFGGALVSQTNKFLGAYERLMDEFIWSITTGITAFVFSMGVLFFVSYRYALVLLLVSTIYAVLIFRRTRKQLPFNQDESEKESRQTAALADAITNMTTIRSFGSEKMELKRFSKIADRSLASSRKLSVEVLKTEALSHAQTNTFNFLAFLFGLIAVSVFQTNIGVLYLTISYTASLVDRLWQFSRIMRNINRSFGDSYEMTEILGVKPEIKNPTHPKSMHAARGEIVFKDVRFSYPENPDEPLFEGLNLKIKAGEKVGLVGPSGGGKTTITKLLLRFMDLDRGQILVDGLDITHVNQEDLRRVVAYVPQEPLLFHRSLQENISYGDPDATDQAIIGVAKLAHAHEFIQKLSKGYETLVGERGIKLSGGQRQRVAIARALLKNAPILVLDEATSALDSESEKLIQEALTTLMEGRTAIVIAHRLSTIQRMDRILVLENGAIVEQGSHKELLRLNGTYAKLWSHQSGGFIED